MVGRTDAPTEIGRLKQSQADDLLMFGSVTTRNPLLDNGSVDELIVLVGPAVLGAGSTLYSGPGAGMRLLAAHVLPSPQLVRLRYPTNQAES